jgi:hypothetical protein
MRADGDMYIQGLWENDLTRGLLWFVVDPQPLEKKELAILTNVNGPSWSWISVMGRHIEYPLGIYCLKPFLLKTNKLLLNKPSHEPTIRCLVNATSYIEHIPAPLLISGHLEKGKDAALQGR